MSETHSSCPTPWKKFFATEFEAEDALDRIARYPDHPTDYPRDWYVCPFTKLSPRGGLEFHYHLTSLRDSRHKICLGKD